MRGEPEFLKTAQCAVLSGEVSKRIRPARTVPEAAVDLTATEKARRLRLAEGSLLNGK